MTASLSNPKEYQNIFHWAETQQDGTIPSFGLRKNDPYEVSFEQPENAKHNTNNASQYQSGFNNRSILCIHAKDGLVLTNQSCASEAVPGTLPQGQNSPRNVRFGLYAEQMTASAFVAPRHLNKKAWLYRARPSVAHQGFVRRGLSHV